MCGRSLTPSEAIELDQLCEPCFNIVVEEEHMFQSLQEKFEDTESLNPKTSFIDMVTALSLLWDPVEAEKHILKNSRYNYFISCKLSNKLSYVPRCIKHIIQDRKKECLECEPIRPFIKRCLIDYDSFYHSMSNSPAELEDLDQRAFRKEICCRKRLPPETVPWLPPEWMAGFMCRH
jgi:hypothetical protein